MAFCELEEPSMPIAVQSPVQKLAHAFWKSLGNAAQCLALQRCAHAHFDEFDNFDVADEQRTSALLPRMRFPIPSVTGPKPTQHFFPRFDHSEWFRFDTDTLARMQDDNVSFQNPWTHNDNMSASTFFHGCPFGAVLGMIRAGGFIPGPGKCRKNGIKVKACF